MVPAGSRPFTSHDKFDVVREFVSASKVVESMADLRELINLGSA